ncbi:hypothetical protein TRIUR3_10133 [Triticum urartu]|uniref:Uncharacterized protein n=1 Tax=Triticum urartu TaxID=4572 RepID=M7YEZ4_TRIUA|nr:hypothetical protein TRIUR3_10133 [Triticum urartu]
MEMVQSALVAEAVSAAVSFLFTGRGEKASPERLMERMEMAHTRLSLGLERTRRMPMTIIPLFCLKKKLKDAFEECDGLLDKARDLRQVVPSFPTKIMQAVLPSFVVPKQDVLSSSVVGRFEWLAEEADKFVRDVESGSSLSHYRFLNPLIGQLLEGRGAGRFDRGGGRFDHGGRFDRGAGRFDRGGGRFSWRRDSNNNNIDKTGISDTSEASRWEAAAAATERQSSSSGGRVGGEEQGLRGFGWRELAPSH